MATLTIELAQAKLTEIIRQLKPGEEITITDHGAPLAHVRKAEPKNVPSQPVSEKTIRPGPGLCAGMMTYMAADFDAPLEDMKEYME